MPAVTTPPCSWFAASLIRPVSGWFVLSTTFEPHGAYEVANLMRRELVNAFGRDGRHAPLPMTNLGDGCFLVRFVAKQRPRLSDIGGRRLIVEPPRGSVVQVVSELRPLISDVGVIPMMQQIRLLKLVEPEAAFRTPGPLDN
ncbi:MAG: hypothetical protein ABSC06_34560 [Rhodopila sp.]|jgi:hypothetical protein